MRAFGRWLGSCAIVGALAGVAVAHGGSYSGGAGQDPGPPLGPPYHPPKLGPDPEATPGGNDPKVAVTRWETWWAANKENYLRLAERLAGDGPNTTGGAKAPLSERAQKAEAKRLEALKKRMLDFFVEMVADKEFEVRTAAAIALGKSGDPFASEVLRGVARKDEEKDVRDSAVLGLGLLGRPADVGFLDQILSDAKENTRRRAFAAFSLGLIGGDDAAAPLLRFAAGPADGGASELKKHPEIAASVFAAMGLTGSASVLPTLRAAAVDREHDEGVRSFAVISLGRMKDRQSLSTLQTILVSEKDVGLRRAAAVALGRVVLADDKSAVQALVDAMTDDRDFLARRFATMSLGGIPSPTIRGLLRDRFEKGKDEDASFAALALALQKDVEFAPEIRAALARRTDESFMGACCIALGLLADAPSAPAVEKALVGAKHIWLQGYAAISLGLIGMTSSINPLHERLTAEKDPRLRMNLAVALGILHDPSAKTYLVDTLRASETYYERSSAALGLGALRCTGAAQDLEAVARDPKEKELLRAFAVVALGEIVDASPIPKLTRFSIDGNYDGAVKVDPLNEILSIY